MSEKLNTRASGIIAAAVMCSRVLGLVREVLFNSLFGTASMGLFLIAFRAPNLLRDLFAEGALSTAFVTVFSQRIRKEGEASAWVLASKMMTLAAVFMSFVSLLGIVFAKQLISVLAPGFAPQDAAARAPPRRARIARPTRRNRRARQRPASLPGPPRGRMTLRPLAPASGFRRSPGKLRLQDQASRAATDGSIAAMRGSESGADHGEVRESGDS